MLILESGLPVLASDVLGTGSTVQEQLWGNLTDAVDKPHEALTTALGTDFRSSLSATALNLRGLKPEEGYNAIFLYAEVNNERPDVLYIVPQVGHRADAQGYRGQPINIQPHGFDFERVTGDPRQQAVLAEAVWEGVSDGDRDSIARRFLIAFERTAAGNIESIPADQERQAAYIRGWKVRYPRVPYEGTDFAEWEAQMRGVLSFAERLRGSMERGTVRREVMPRSATLKFIPS